MSDRDGLDSQTEFANLGTPTPMLTPTTGGDLPPLELHGMLSDSALEVQDDLSGLLHQTERTWTLDPHASAASLGFEDVIDCLPIDGLKAEEDVASVKSVFPEVKATLEGRPGGKDVQLVEKGLRGKSVSKGAFSDAFIIPVPS